MSPRHRALPALLALVGALALVAIWPAVGQTDATTCAQAAATAAGSCFEAGDGDQVAGAPGTTDWQADAASGALTGNDDPLPDSAFAAGQEDTPDSWSLTAMPTGVSPAKSDALGFWTASERSGGSLYLYSAFERELGTGDSFVGVEVNRRDPGYRQSGGVDVPTRSAGDVLLTYAIKSNGIEIGVCRWAGDEHAGSWQPYDPAKPTDAQRCTPVDGGLAVGAVNSTALDAAANFLPRGGPLAPGQFGEGAINLTSVFPDAATLDPCRSFGSTWLHTRTSQDVNSRPVDYIAAHRVVDAVACPQQAVLSLRQEGVAPPELGRSVVIERVGGQVSYKRKGSRRFFALTAPTNVPVGSTIDTTNGVVNLISATDFAGHTQSGHFYDGAFTVHQARAVGAIVDLVLQDSPKATASGTRAHAARVLRHRRRLWGNAHGRFRTRGSFSSATVRGTLWLVRDTGDATITHVNRGVVVVRDFERHRTVIVKAGHSYRAAPVAAPAIVPKFTG